MKTREFLVAEAHRPVLLPPQFPGRHHQGEQQAAAGLAHVEGSGTALPKSRAFPLGSLTVTLVPPSRCAANSTVRVASQVPIAVPLTVGGFADPVNVPPPDTKLNPESNNTV